jgi:MFS family permease
MFERFRRSGAATAEREPQPGVTTPQPPAAAAPATTASTDGCAAQYEQFGGVKWGAAFFGWLVAVGLSVILIALVSAAGAAVGLSSSPGARREAAQTAGLIGGILLVAILMLGYYCGGYVAGRMSRFDGGRQGAAVWIFGLVVAIVLAIAGAVLGSQFNVLSQLKLPRIPIDEGTLTTGGLVTLAAVVVGTFLAAATGGKAGHRYHRRVDRAAAG